MQPGAKASRLSDSLRCKGKSRIVKLRSVAVPGVEHCFVLHFLEKRDLASTSLAPPSISSLMMFQCMHWLIRS